MHTTYNDRPFDIVLYGATSFVGQITAKYLSDFIKNVKNGEVKDSDVKFAIAGRNSKKLDGVLQKLDNPNVGKIIADSKDDASLQAMCQSAKVIISTVGPYINVGEALVKACVENGNDYVDLTGESLFIKRMMDKYKHIAQQTGARIVHSCGFDSIPSDLGVLFTQQTANQPCDTINMRVRVADGGLSGGTIASLVSIFSEIATNPESQVLIDNHYILNDDDTPPTTVQEEHQHTTFDKNINRWLSPFIMENINTRIVHRSNQLMDYAYGKDFKYDEAVSMPNNLWGRAKSHGMSVGLDIFSAAMGKNKVRDNLTKYILPKPGSGPSKKAQKNGSFDIRFYGYTNNQNIIKTQVTGSKDPGYGSTSMMLAQAALCLLQDIDKQTIKGGFWTPASAMGSNLISRLQEHAEMEFTVL